MITLDAEVFTLIERKDERKINKVPQYPLPCRTYFSIKIMPQLYENLNARIREKLTSATNISFTTDIWTCSTNNEAFIH